MLKKILKQLKQMSHGSSERRHGHYHRGSSSHRGYKRYPMSGSDRYKRKGRSSS
ncbi:MAG TPA: hypothetical protein VNM69_12295 [Bacillus sp. (in: firmicutes)]|uniref:hypothetical protein n=1 Tax=Bacillus litorisediminis TaxID=2922713 RepID=UPI001FAE010D|nr:hypothetical protein [Bacillus litorisediminis]HWO76660.1 hypothetical protein [Bacillus sp. (in: firmicutes)]